MAGRPESARAVAQPSSESERAVLDEPTNNLDLRSVHWLQRYLCDYEGVLIVISHDRHFLNSVCTHTCDIDYETIIMYNGGYDDMVVAKTQVPSRIESENASAKRKSRSCQEFIARFSAGTRSAARPPRARKKSSGCRLQSLPDRISSGRTSNLK